MGKKFVLGDIHGNFMGLQQILQLSNFDKENDTLIFLGDVVDGWPDTAECIEELLSIKHLIPLIGNHCYWCRNWLEYGWKPPLWLMQGGEATFDSYVKNNYLREKHLNEYFKKLHLYYIDEDHNAYVHGGYTSLRGLGNDAQDTYMWDRTLWDKAKSAKSTGKLNLTEMYNKVFIGHTSVGYREPQKACNVWDIDSGSGWEGCLTIMNVDTEEYFQSNQTKLLYPNVKGR
jgi:serine/threonine protein phosphatase 1